VNEKQWRSVLATVSTTCVDQTEVSAKMKMRKEGTDWEELIDLERLDGVMIAEGS
jgi:hypothetical protein